MSLETLTGRGLVLKRTRHMDEDLKLILLMEDIGKVHVLSKGTQKMVSKLRPLNEPFVEGEFHLALPPHGVSGRLIGGRLLESNRFLCEKFDRFEVASRMCETVDVMLPHRAPAPEVYGILRQSLQNLKGRQDPVWVWVEFAVALLKSLGHGDLRETRSLEPESKENLSTWMSLVDAELERVLPRRLKSAV